MIKLEISVVSMRRNIGKVNELNSINILFYSEDWKDALVKTVIR